MRAGRCSEFDQRRQLVQRRLQFGMRKTLGLKATREAVHINRESPAPDSTAAFRKDQGFGLGGS